MHMNRISKWSLCIEYLLFDYALFFNKPNTSHSMLPNNVVICAIQFQRWTLLSREQLAFASIIERMHKL